EVYNTVQRLAASMRKDPRPVLIEFRTFRMRGHEEASGTKYVPDELMEAWALRDPIANYEDWLGREINFSQEEIESTRNRLKEEIRDALRPVIDEAAIESSIEAELSDVYSKVDVVHWERSEAAVEMRFVDAVRDGLRESMRQFPELVLMGQDIAEYGGVFKVTEGFVQEFGRERVRNTPICESAIVGCALGLSMKGYKAMVGMAFGDCVPEGLTKYGDRPTEGYDLVGTNAA